MALCKEDGRDDAPECPVCYECLSGTERTLSCGHVFCHDCLVRTLVSIDSNGRTRDTLVCPVCRHLTFITKQADTPASDGLDEGQTLEVPLPGARSPDGLGAVARCFREISDRVRRQKLISPGHSASRIFVISAEGRPMADGEALGVIATVMPPQRRRRRRVCTTSRCLVVLLLAFTLLAMVAAVLPWLLLV